MIEERVSVIVPVYNIEDYLPRCLACIEMQTYRNIEIILVDDGSTDGSGRICDEYAAKDSRARVIHHPENRGLWAARNTGQDAATGDYLWFPDGDDYFHKDIVKVMHEAINQTSSSGELFDLAIVRHKETDRFDEDISSIVSPSFVERPLEYILEAFLRIKCDFSGRVVWNKLCRRRLTEGIRTGEYRYAEDCDFSMKLYLRAPKIVCVDKVLYYYVSRNSSQTHSPNFYLNDTQCWVRLLFDNYLSCQAGNVSCRGCILEMLYIKMATLLDLVQGNALLDTIRRECKDITRLTYRDYLKSDKIKTPSKRFRRLLRVRFDRLYHTWLSPIAEKARN